MTSISAGDSRDTCFADYRPAVHMLPHGGGSRGSAAESDDETGWWSPRVSSNSSLIFRETDGSQVASENLRHLTATGLSAATDLLCEVRGQRSAEWCRLELKTEVS